MLRRVASRRSRQTHQEEGKDDTPQEQPPSDVEWNGHATVVCIWRTTVEDGVRPRLGRQHGDGSKDIGDVDQEALEDDDIEPEILHAHAEAIVGEFSSVDEVELPEERRSRGGGDDGELSDADPTVDFNTRTLWSGTTSRFQRAPEKHISPQQSIHR